MSLFDMVNGFVMDNVWLYIPRGEVETGIMENDDLVWSIHHSVW